jgi:hypothetical protein
MVGLLGTITGGSNGTAGTYGGVPLTGGSGSGATANITVASGHVTAVAVLNPGSQYAVGDVLSAASGNIGGTTGFSVPVATVAINSSLAGGSVGFYIPSTLTTKQTWFNPDQVGGHQNTNPVVLDANGCAIIYGSGQYRQILKDSLGNTIWDQLTNDTSGTTVMWAGLAGGTPNAITVTAPNFNGTDGQQINFIAASNNSGPTTVNPSSFGNVSTVKDTISGTSSLSGGEIISGTIVELVYDATGSVFHITTQPQISSVSSPVVPQGYLTLLNAGNGGPIQLAADVTAATSVYYSPYVGNVIPIWNGSVFLPLVFSELTLTLNASAHLANTLYDACVFSNSGTLILVTGPAWSTSTAGSGNRGSGGGTPQLQRLNGIWVNAVQITGVNGGNNYTVPANKCTYVGTIYIDSVAGQISSYRTYGQNRKFGTWNAYNRMQICLRMGDSTASWNYSTAAFRSSNNNSANAVTVLAGLQEEIIEIKFVQFAQNGTAANPSIAIGLNSVGARVGKIGANIGPSNSYSADLVAFYDMPPTLGVNTILSAESSSSSNAVTFNGTESNMLLTACWRG